MIKHKDHFHGSDLEKIEEIYGIKKEEIVSFSANVNPLGVSPLLKHTLSDQIDAITSYPDREYTSLRRCIAAYCGTETENVIVGNGSTELISLFIQVEHPKKALVIGPTYSEYEREIALGGGTTLYYPLREADDFKLNVEDFLSHLNESIDLLVICNPNNPTSSSIPRSDMRHILDVCKQYDIYVMVDETYVEFADNMAELTAVPLTNYYNNIVILRGTSKFFAAPGIRLGYGISSNQAFLDRFKTNTNPWSVNSLADFIGQHIFTDFEFHKKTQALVSSERRKAFAELSTWKNIKAYPSEANFILLKLKTDRITAHELFEKCIQKKMLIRDASSFTFLDESYLRFCILSPEHNAALLAELKKWVEA